jgi:hypothetical protein
LQEKASRVINLRRVKSAQDTRRATAKVVVAAYWLL